MSLSKSVKTNHHCESWKNQPIPFLLSFSRNEKEEESSSKITTACSQLFWIRLCQDFSIRFCFTIVSTLCSYCRFPWILCLLLIICLETSSYLPFLSIEYVWIVVFGCSSSRSEFERVKIEWWWVLLLVDFFFFLVFSESRAIRCFQLLTVDFDLSILVSNLIPSSF